MTDLTRVDDGPVATVYSGHRAGVPVALKVFPKRFDKRTASAFTKEQAKLSSVRRITSILMVDGVEEMPSGESAVRMELCTQSLAALVERVGPLAAADVAVLGRAMATALAAAHSAGVVHGGVAPSNVLFRQNGEPVVADFGVTLRQAFTRDPLHAIEYLPPETLRTGTLNELTDLYGLGAVLHFALSGRSPHPGRLGEQPGERVLRILGEPVPAIDRPDVPVGLSTLVARLLATAPERRPQHASQVADQLTAMLPNPPAPPQSEDWDDFDTPTPPPPLPAAPPEDPLDFDDFGTPSHAGPGGWTSQPRPTTPAVRPASPRPAPRQAAPRPVPPRPAAPPRTEPSSATPAIATPPPPSPDPVPTPPPAARAPAPGLTPAVSPVPPRPPATPASGTGQAPTPPAADQIPALPSAGPVPASPSAGPADQAATLRSAGPAPAMNPAEFVPAPGAVPAVGPADRAAALPSAVSVPAERAPAPGPVPAVGAADRPPAPAGSVPAPPSAGPAPAVEVVSAPSPVPAEGPADRAPAPDPAPLSADPAATSPAELAPAPDSADLASAISPQDVAPAPNPASPVPVAGPAELSASSPGPAESPADPPLAPSSAELASATGPAAPQEVPATTAPAEAETSPAAPVEALPPVAVWPVGLAVPAPELAGGPPAEWPPSTPLPLAPPPIPAPGETPATVEFRHPPRDLDDDGFSDFSADRQAAAVLAAPLAPPGQGGKRLIRYDLLAGAALVLALLALVPLLLLRGDPEEIASTPKVPTARDAGSDVTVELAEPADLADKVRLNWRATRELDFAVVVAAEGEEKARVLLAERNHTMTVDVEPGRKYCFLVQATDGDRVYESEPVALRGATCRK